MKDASEQYRSDENLRARIETHVRYGIGPELEPAIDAALQLRGDESLLDVGTGNGSFPGRLSVGGHRGLLVAIDRHLGMFAANRSRYPGVQFAQADAQQLPFADASFDVVTSRHMLYHVDDIPLALSECSRMLKQGGRFLAVTNSYENMRAFWQVVREAGLRYAPLTSLAERVITSFTDRNAGELIEAAFGNVRVDSIDAALVFPTAEPVERYFVSCLPGTAGIDRDDALRAFRDALKQVWPPSGPWRVSKRVLLLTANRA